MRAVLDGLPTDLRHAADLIERDDDRHRLGRFVDALRRKADVIDADQGIDPATLDTARSMARFFADVAQRDYPTVRNSVGVEECMAAAEIIDQLLKLIGPAPLTDGEFTGQHTGD